MGAISSGAYVGGPGEGATPHAADDDFCNRAPLSYTRTGTPRCGRRRVFKQRGTPHLARLVMLPTLTLLGSNICLSMYVYAPLGVEVGGKKTMKTRKGGKAQARGACAVR